MHTDVILVKREIVLGVKSLWSKHALLPVSSSFEKDDKFIVLQVKASSEAIEIQPFTFIDEDI